MIKEDLRPTLLDLVNIFSYKCQQKNSFSANKESVNRFALKNVQGASQNKPRSTWKN